MGLYWIKEDGTAARQVQWGGPHITETVPPRVRVALADGEVTQMYGPYEDGAAPASIETCTVDKKLKG